ncbi:MAG: ATP-binding cassette domain-containing protein, partial [Armatimonadetes bacterium]|nr:ATP-binding cassette domain-containing protein [Armatimonadota bacterium]
MDQRDVDVELVGVTKRYGDLTAVAGVSLAVHRGEFFSILGPSGCGKTTILRMIAGFIEPSEGEILIAGKPTRGVAPNRRPTSLIFQHLALFPLMNVYDNIAFGLRMRGVSEGEISGRVAAQLELINLSGYGPKRVDQLSHIGQRFKPLDQRDHALRFLRAEHGRRDEPELVLDVPIGRRQIAGACAAVAFPGVACAVAHSERDPCHAARGVLPLVLLVHDYTHLVCNGPHGWIGKHLRTKRGAEQLAPVAGARGDGQAVGQARP